MPKPVAKFVKGDDAVAAWRTRVESGVADPAYIAGSGELARYSIAPGRVTLQGGAPGQGKTAIVMQLTVDALRLNPDLRACVCNVEMSVDALLDRQLARLSGVRLDIIRSRRIEGEAAGRIDVAMGTLEGVADRLCFVKPPYDLVNIAAASDATSADLLILDYIQRIKPPGDSQDKRGSVDATMDYLRQFADNGMAVVVVAAVARTKDKKGRSSYDPAGLNLASFRESSELEFGADDAYLLVPDHSGDGDDRVLLKHLKARHDEMRDIPLEFNRPLQRFTAADLPLTANQRADATEQLKRAWNQAPSGKGRNP